MNAYVWFQALLNRWPSLAFVPIGLLVGATAAAQAADLGRVGPIAGTYELIICKGTCSFSDSRNVFATVVVVLFEDVMAQEDVERIDPSYHSDPPNTCFVIKRKVNAQSYAGIKDKGVSPWLLRGDAIEFDLFHSPDAGYAVEIERRGNLLTGTGRSWGAGMGAPPPEYTPDIVVGRRVGPPNVSSCATEAVIRG